VSLVEQVVGGLNVIFIDEQYTHTHTHTIDSTFLASSRECVLRMN
jgi:hypothetical protein